MIDLVAGQIFVRGSRAFRIDGFRAEEDGSVTMLAECLEPREGEKSPWWEFDLTDGFDFEPVIYH